MDIIKMFQASDIVNVLSGNYMEVVSKYFTVVAIPVLILALMNCFFGNKLFKIFVGVAGIFIGAGAGVGVSIGLNLSLKNGIPKISTILIAGLIGAVLLGIVSFKLYKAGAFCMGAVTGMILGVAIMKLFHKDDYLIAAVIGGLLMGLLAIDLYKHMVILLTSLNGGLIAAACIAIILSKDDPMSLLKTGAVLVIAGTIVQYISLAIGNKKKKAMEKRKRAASLEKNSKELKQRREQSPRVVNIPDKEQEIKNKDKQRVTKYKDDEAEGLIGVTRNVRVNDLEPKGKQTREKETRSRESDIRQLSARKSEIKESTTRESKLREAETNEIDDRNNAGLFFVDLFISIAQFVKDKITAYLNADDIEDDEELEDDYDIEVDDEFEEDDGIEEDDDEFDEDDDIEDYNKELEEDEDINDDDNSEEHDHSYLHEVAKDKYVIEDIQRSSYLQRDSEAKISGMATSSQTIITAKKEVFKDNIQENEFDDIEKKLEEELEQTMRLEEEKDLEDLIIKQTIRNIDIN